jgi:hypothetical protein
MKTTSKILLALFVLFIVSSPSVFAKKKGQSSGSSQGRFSIGAELALPTGNFSDAYNIGFGGSLRYEMPMNDNISFTGTAGYLSFSGKTTDGYTLPNFSSIPIQVGAKYYFQGGQAGFYGAVEVGVHISSFKEEIPVYDYATGNLTYIEQSESETDFSIAPGVGYVMNNWDFGLKYQIISASGGSLDYFGVRVAYVLGGK